MKDIHRVWLLWFVALAPFLLVMLAGVFLFMPEPTTPSTEWALAGFLASIFAGLVFWKSSRLRHYNKTFAEYEENYCYVKEEAQ